MCKNVVAGYTAWGARLDDDPSLFFALRQINIDDIVSQTVNPYFSPEIYYNVASGSIFKRYLIDCPHRTVRTIAGFNHRNA